MQINIRNSSTENSTLNSPPKPHNSSRLQYTPTGLPLVFFPKPQKINYWNEIAYSILSAFGVSSIIISVYVLHLYNVTRYNLRHANSAKMLSQNSYLRSRVSSKCRVPIKDAKSEHLETVLSHCDQLHFVC